jgi:hypothetical protein
VLSTARLRISSPLRRIRCKEGWGDVNIWRQEGWGKGRATIVVPTHVIIFGSKGFVFRKRSSSDVAPIA